LVSLEIPLVVHGVMARYNHETPENAGGISSSSGFLLARGLKPRLVKV
jgi:hypothetical protein